MTHTPANPYCGACRFAKCLRTQHRKGAMKRHGTKPTKEGELMTADWTIAKSEVSRGGGGETVMLNVLDVGCDHVTVHPSVKRDTEAAYDGILQAYGNRKKVKFAYIDNAPELKAACRAHRIPFRTSAPYVHQANGLIESINKQVLYGTKVALEQAGAPPCFWPYAAKHYVFSFH